MYNFTFTKITKQEMPFLLEWFKAPHVSKWWPVPSKNELFEDFLIRIRSKNTFGYMVNLEGVPIGYIQYYFINRNFEKTGSWLPGLPENTVGTDQFIGDLNLIGKGLGTEFIKKFLKHLVQIEPSITTIIVDPDPQNFAAIKCYEKVGFKKDNEYDAPWGRALLMRYDF
jgi:aminoglycoside 6'-N-acetyltransferase